MAHYNFRQTLSDSGTARTYLADRDGNRYVIKEIQFSTPISDPSQARQRGVLEEFDLFSRIRHESLVSLEDYFLQDGKLYYVFAYVEGRSLRDVLEDPEIKRRGYGLRYREAAGYLIDICDGLACLHSKNLVHLDIKPENVIITPQDRAVVVDYGSVRQAYTAPGVRAITRSAIEGTLPYASVEQLEYRSAARSPQSDIWSCGVLFYEMLQGSRVYPYRPTGSGSAGDWVEAAERFRGVKGIPGPLAKVIETCLQIDYTQRYRTVVSLAEKVDQAMVQLAKERTNDHRPSARARRLPQTMPPSPTTGGMTPQTQQRKPDPPGYRKAVQAAQRQAELSGDARDYYRLGEIFKRGLALHEATEAYNKAKLLAGGNHLPSQNALDNLRLIRLGDMSMRCACGSTWIYTVADQQWFVRMKEFQNPDYREPKRCPSCLKAKQANYKTTARPQGTIKWYSANQGYGFIVSSDAGGNGDIFFHISRCEYPSGRTPEQGDAVTFDYAEKDGKPQAYMVRLRGK